MKEIIEELRKPPKPSGKTYINGIIKEQKAYKKLDKSHKKKPIKEKIKLFSSIILSDNPIKITPTEKLEYVKKKPIKKKKPPVKKKPIPKKKPVKKLPVKKKPIIKKNQYLKRNHLLRRSLL